MENITTTFLTFIETVSALYVFDAYFKNKRKNKEEYFCAAIGVSLCFMVAWNIPVIQENSILRTGAGVLLYLITWTILFKGSILSKLVVTIMIMVMFYAIDYMAIGIVMVNFKLNFKEVLVFSELNIMISFISKLILLVICILINRLKGSKYHSIKLSAYECVQLLMFPLVTLTVLLVFIETALRQGNVTKLTLICSVTMIAANIVTFIIVDTLNKEKKTKEENSLLQQKIEIEMNNVIALMDAYKEQRKFTHDFNNHLSVIGMLIKNGDVDKLQEYSKQLIQDVRHIGPVVNTNNLIVDALVNQKYIIAKKRNIIMEFAINDLKNIPIKDEDMVVVLSNAIDNAIEACLKVEKEKVINIKIMNKPKEMTILIKNTMVDNTTIKGSEITSSKNDALNHGYGIKNINDVLYKYNSNAMISCNNGWFTLLAKIYKI